MKLVFPMIRLLQVPFTIDAHIESLDFYNEVPPTPYDEVPEDDEPPAIPPRPLSTLSRLSVMDADGENNWSIGILLTHMFSSNSCV